MERERQQNGSLVNGYTRAIRSDAQQKCPGYVAGSRGPHPQHDLHAGMSRVDQHAAIGIDAERSVHHPARGPAAESRRTSPMRRTCPEPANRVPAGQHVAI